MEQSLGRGTIMQPGGTPEALQPRRYEVRPYKPEDAQLIYDELEKPNWAPWLAASPETLARRAEVFPEGQIALWDQDGRPVASLSLNRFTWDGNVHNLPTWDQLAGDPPTYENTYENIHDNIYNIQKKEYKKHAIKKWLDKRKRLLLHNKIKKIITPKQFYALNRQRTSKGRFMKSNIKFVLCNDD